MSNKVDFESAEYDTTDVLLEDARIDAIEHAYDRQRRAKELLQFENRVLQYAVSSCIDSCLDSLDLLYIRREQNPVSDIAVAHNSWQQEAEPEPCNRDSWLRGAIPETPAAPRVPQTTQQQQATSNQKEIPQSGSSTRKGGSASKPSTADNDQSSQQHSSTSAGSTRARAAPAATQTTVKSTSGASTTAASAATATCRKIEPSKPAGKQLTQEQQEAEARLRQELQIRRQQEDIAKDLKQKDEQARAALMAAQKELKGKDYTYDSSGKIVILNKLNPETLPAPPGPQFKLQTTTAADADAAAAQSSTKRSSTSASPSTATASKSKSTKKSSAAGTSSRDFIQTASITQPPVLETLKPAAGVTVRAGTNARQGPKREVSGQTRSQYQQQAKVQNQQAARLLRASAQTANSRASAIGVSLGSGSNPRTSSVSSTTAAAGAAASSSRTSTVQGLSSGSQVDAAGAAVKAAAASPGAADPPGSNSRLGMAPETASGSAMAQQATVSAVVPAAAPQKPPGPDINLLLVSAADWGVAAGSGYSPPDPLQVIRPSEKQIAEDFGRTTHLPKSRACIATLKPPSQQPGC